MKAQTDQSMTAAVLATLLIGCLAGCLVPTQVSAQEVQADSSPTVTSAKIGQRQDRSDAAPNIRPMARIENRIQTRVQLRINNRLDRSYSSPVNAASPASPFTTASDQARATGR